MDGAEAAAILLRHPARARITFTDGEIIEAGDFSVFPGDDIFVYELLTSNRAEKYEHYDVQPAYTGKLSEIVNIEPLETEADCT